MCLQMYVAVKFLFCFFCGLVLCIIIHVEWSGEVDCEQSPFFFQFSEGSARACKQRAARRLLAQPEQSISLESTLCNAMHCISC